jgi:TRAP-type mannitol/chloroaromatic compound transport system permease small subunit
VVAEAIAFTAWPDLISDQFELAAISLRAPPSWRLWWGPMGTLLTFSRAIDWLTFRIGKLMGWLVFAAVLVSSLNALSRYMFNASSNAWLELQWYLFGAVVLLGAAYTLQQNEHIRIDIVNARLKPRTRNIIELVGHVLFLMPLCIMMVWMGVPFFLRAFTSGEISASAGGLIIWPAKLLVPVGFALLLLQGVSELIKRIAIMQGLIDDPFAGKGGHAPPPDIEPEASAIHKSGGAQS